MTNFGLADTFLKLIGLQNDFKEVITRFQKYVYFPEYSGVRTLQLRDIASHKNSDKIHVKIVLGKFGL